MKIKLQRKVSFFSVCLTISTIYISENSKENVQILHIEKTINKRNSHQKYHFKKKMASLIKIFPILLIFCFLLMHKCQGQNSNVVGGIPYHYKVIVDCLNRPDNNGNFFVNVYYTDTTQGWRAKALTGSCRPGTFVNFNVNEEIGYVWIKAQSKTKAYFKVTTQQPINGVYIHQSWSYAGKSAFITTYDHMPIVPTFPTFPDFTKCDSHSGVHGNGWCELTGSTKTILTTKIPPYTGTVHDVSLTAPSSYTAFAGLSYVGITKGGALGMYWDYRNNTWFSDDCYTFTAHFSDGHSFEVTCPTRDFTSKNDASTQASSMLVYVGQVPKYVRAWLKTFAVNGGGPGSRAGANTWRRSMNLNLEPWIRATAYKLFLHEGAHVGLLSVQNSQKWNLAQVMDPIYISTYARGSPLHEDVAESYVCWLIVRRNPRSVQSQKIRRAIPNRLAVFDDLVWSKYPVL